ncbi:LysR substrate-binding domain-containing protein [Bradyrhizobium sp. 2S1]|uniref:LysR substrate-binding domain-containing protein n=1 Tax=Bradyrhizobium sp. 2S1 TaxID=1404429 RepID=UPI00140B58C1
MPLAVKAAKSGLGAAISSQVLVRSNLKKGELVAPFGFVPIDRSIYMFVSEHARNMVAVKEFRRRVLAEILSRDYPLSPLHDVSQEAKQVVN